MTDNEIKINLCHYDENNPYNILDLFEDDDRPQPRNGCVCDNCFYGRDKLAVQILEKRRERDEAREPIDFFDATNAFIDAALQRYAYRNEKDADLTQVFMRGPFAGWSERQVVELVRQLDENRNLHRLEP